MQLWVDSRLSRDPGIYGAVAAIPSRFNCFREGDNCSWDVGKMACLGSTIGLQHEIPLCYRQLCFSGSEVDNVFMSETDGM